MNNLIAISSNGLLLLLSTGFAWFAVEYLPSGMALFWLAAAVLLDLITGLLKAWSKRMCSTSAGFRKTIIKIGTYCATIVVLTILVNIISFIDVNHRYPLEILINGLLAFMTFIELFSVCENISLAYPRAPLTKYLIDPLLKFMKGRLKQGPPGISNQSPNPS